MEKTWDIEKIQQILPQAYPFLFVDKVIDIDVSGSKITCLKNISINDGFLEGHFPGKPVMPGALIIEAMAQSSILLYAAVKPEALDKNPSFFLGAVDVKFKKAVQVGDQLILEVAKEKIIDSGGMVSVIARVGEQVVAKGTLSFGVKFNEQGLADSV